jgi:energy-coupling factor transporter ATP-binding protein EcfA2
VHCRIFCSYRSLWDEPVALVAYSFGGLVLKSLVVEARKHVNQRSRNDLDDEVHKCCETFLNNVKGVVFYGVPHVGAPQNLSNYFAWQHQQINTLSKDATLSGISKNLEYFNTQMAHLSTDFKDAIHEDLNIYAFGEGLPLDKNWGILVPFASAIELSNNNHYKIEDAHHLTICKPPNKGHPSYFLLLQCLRICTEKNILLPPLPCHEVALIDKAKAINVLLRKESIVGLVGMGGIGKTTLCKKFYHLFHNEYDKSSFLEDVKSKDDINDVIKQLLHDLCGKRLRKDENVSKKDIDQIRQCMISKKVLVVVDDVGNAKNLTSLQLVINKYAKNTPSKSKVLVNCRNWQHMKAHVKEDGKMVMQSLQEKQARELFMFHAFGNTNHVPTKDFKDICMKIIEACGGLPLSLKVLGSFLCDTKDLELWKGALSKLKNGQSFTGGNDNEELWSKLKISYDHLDKEHQNMFLDIACFLGGLKISTIYQVWSGHYLYPKLALQNLQHRSLIQWVEGGILYIHEQLRDMGQYIAREPPIMNRFIWKSNMSNFFLQKDEVVTILFQSYNFIMISYDLF